LLTMLEVPEVTRRVLLSMLEVVEGRLCLLEVLGTMRCMLKPVEGGSVWWRC